MSETQSSMKGFIVLSRIPFLTPGLAALISAIFIAAIDGSDPDLVLSAMSVIGVSFIMLATYYFNEFYDFEGDVANRKFIQFSGGSRALPDKLVPMRTAKIAGLGAVVVLVVIAAVYLLFFFDDYPLLLPLGLFGAFCGIFYTVPPFQWAYQGIGEIMIGGCYGVLTFVSGYYLASGTIDLRLILLGMPAALTVFCVIVANEFPDYEADRAVNKRNLIVRLGVSRGSIIYVVAMALVYPMMVLSVLVGVPWTIVLWALPALLLCAAAIGLTLKGGYADKQAQTKISGITILANVASCVLFLPAIFLGA
jgi:1,4-dihydroxy-2-naphthoate polyprenyltransferase